MRDLDRAGFYAKTRDLANSKMHEKLMELFKLVELAEKDIGGDYNWELAKHEAGLPSEIS